MLTDRHLLEAKKAYAEEGLGWGGWVLLGDDFTMYLHLYIRKEEILKQFPIARFLNLINVCVSVCACEYTVGVGVGE